MNMGRFQTAIIFFIGMGFISTIDSLSAGPILRVGAVGSPPFVLQEDGKTEGIAPELWEEVARAMNVRYRLIPYKSVAAGLRAVDNGQVDLSIGSISITAERSEKIDFSHPYYRSVPGILVRRSGTSLWKTIRPFISITFIIGIVTLLTVLFIVGNLIWFAEKKKNDAIPEKYTHGVAQCMWFAVVTFTTVGYGDIAPITRVGRVMTAVWMIIAMITASSLTAGIASSFTLFQLRHVAVDSAESLDGVRAATVRGTTGHDFARRYDARVLPFATLKMAIESFRSREVSVLIFDYPVLRYYMRNISDPDIKAIETRSSPEYYGFAFRRGSPLRGRVNRALLKTLEAGELRRIKKDWLQEK